MEVHNELTEIKEYLRHHRIAMYAIIVVLIVLTYALVIALKSTRTPLSNTTVQKDAENVSQTKTTTVELKTEYENPFAEETQYVNPFSTSKNPFDTLQ